MRRADDARSRRRAGRWVRRTLRREVWAEAWQARAVLVPVTIGYVVAIAILVWVMAAWRPGTRVAAFIAGVGLGGVPALVQAFHVGTGIASRRMGADAEQWTAKELARLDARCWVVFHDVPLSQANVDHVAIGPRRVYAIETKWTGGTPHDALVARWARQARGRAEELRRRMTEHGAEREVVPMLVLWGSGVRRARGDAPAMVSGTRVVTGAAASDWIPRMTSAGGSVVIDHPAVSSVGAIVRRAEEQEYQEPITHGLAT